MKHKLMIITHLLITLLTIPSYLSQNDEQLNQTCRQPIRCGNTMGIGYPFWAGDRACGDPGFKLHCRDNILRINISSLSYRVLDIDSTTQTLRIARDDLSNTLCAPLPLNTTLNSTLFDFSSTANDNNITILYGCSNPNPPAAANHRFNCADSQSLFLTMEAASEARSKTNLTCDRNIYVPVSEKAARDLGSPGPGPPALMLQSALAGGFSIQWSVKNDCRNCIESGGLCENSDQGPGSFVCYCSDGPHNFTCNDAGSKKGLSNLHKYIIIGLSLGLAAGIVLSSLFFHITKKYRSRKPDHESNQHIDKVLLNHGSLAPKRYNYTQIKKITKSFKDKLGRGAYGIVYKGKLPDDGQLVAVKVLTGSDNDAQDFINEVSSISKTSHVNIVNLLGFCYDSKNRALVYEYMPNKSLDNFISKNGRDLDWEKMYKIAVGVARGLEYLHSGCNTRIVHFDIKPQNILLDEDFCPKISDFGLAKLFRKKQSILSMLGMRGTVGYIAPEVFSRSFGVVSHKSDVYSYGMMLLEMAGAKKIVEIEVNESSEDFFHDRIYEHAMLENEGLDSLMTEESEESARKMLLVGVWCIQIAPSDRPSMTKVVEMLEGSVGSIQIPPKPIISTPMLSPKSSCSDSTTMESD
ncbi:hypothetical protein CASFOL_023335 [Castilleja foliolosa]|uniref:non-specific serine/threonine protein kinase n=1 Tax=Castilleja foliolosa TaxID=1961234 RepID=A0ABD3CKA6_9LAMI